MAKIRRKSGISHHINKKHSLRPLGGKEQKIDRQCPVKAVHEIQYIAKPPELIGEGFKSPRHNREFGVRKYLYFLFKPFNMAATQGSKKRKFVADGVFKAELNNFLTRELAEDGYSGVEVRVTPTRTEIIILATRTQNVLGEKGRRIRELTSVVQKRFSFPEGTVELYAEKVAQRGLCAIAQCESLRYKLIGGLAVRRACYGVLRFIMESGAKGCEVVVSGKLRGQRAKSMKFVDGLMIHSGEPINDYVDTAVRHVLLRQGVLGIKVKIMLPWDPSGKIGPKKPLPDHVNIVEPKEEQTPAQPYSEQKGTAKPGAPEPAQTPQA
ncbi:40S ribosomal protein S3-like [Pecten maximus]|uniref:40S ribosomal protein S3-like n=1 Tax=Pecten maximus TaxID=6579 RepID=UPI0014590097|nr:40S ribosomal protein S3-like [Pecten maximus]